MDFFDAVYIGLTMVVEWPAIGYLVLGVILGMFFGAVPGLSGLVGMAILLPFTFGMEPGSAFAFLLGMYAVTTTADTLASVLLGIPGTAASQATILDGYPMARRGEAARALGAAYTVSMFGGVIGAIILAVSIPVVRPIILSFSDPEFFALAVLGLTMVGSLSGNSIFKGCASACIGLLLAAVGYAEFGGIPRYWLNMNYLLDGIPIVPYVLGLFALPELLELAVRNTSISQVERAEVKGGMLDGIKDAGKYWWLGLRCTAIGVYVGMLPGLGGSIVDWVAYGHAAQSTKDNPQFGKGDIRGVIAPEAANNAMKGGALLPTIAFAIPGSASMAILLGAFLIQGLEPGPQMLTTKLHVSFSLVWTLVIANVLGAGLLLAWGNQVAKVTFVQAHILVPAIILFVFMGAWMGKSSLGDWITLLGFGLLGYLMKQGGWPRPPLVLGLILGKIMETSLNLAVQTHGSASFTRPIVLIISVLIVITVVFAIRGQKRRRRRALEALDAPKVEETVDDIKIAGEEGGTQVPAVSLPLALVALVMFCYGYYESIPWKPSPQMFPQAVTITAVLLTLCVIYQDIKGLMQVKSGRPPAGTLPVDLGELGKGFYFLSWMLGILLLTMLLGQFVALLVFVVLYLKIWGKFGWRMIAIYTVLSGIMLYVLFNMVVPVLWYESPFYSFMS